MSARRGDVVSTTRQNLDIFLASDAIAADPTFGSDFYGLPAARHDHRGQREL